jgi:3-hydroxyisobutyrate dehydrogenase
MAERKQVAFVGLGAMGWGIAANLAAAAKDGKIASPVLVWNRTTSKSEQHEARYGTRCARALPDVSQADVIITCLPTSTEVADVARELAPAMKSGSLWIDCTSGDPDSTKYISRMLKEAGITMIDCPVSGGPDGAASGQLTAMVGGDTNDVAQSVINIFAKKKIVRCGIVGAGHAVKAMNNCLNAAHLIVAGEALLALKKWGVQPEVALQAINASSGRSLQTEVRIPTQVLTRRFDYGFKLGLMLKDVRIAVDGLAACQEDRRGNSILTAVKKMLEQSVTAQGYDVDYTCVLRTLELEAGCELQGSAVPTAK